MVFQAIHTPESDAANLEKESPKFFQNLWNKLYVVPGAPVIITSNINPSLSLFNGAREVHLTLIFTQNIIIVLKILKCFKLLK